MRGAVSVKLNTDTERAEWLQCLAAAACMVDDAAKSVGRVVEVADRLLEEYRKRADG